MVSTALALEPSRTILPSNPRGQSDNLHLTALECKRFIETGRRWGIHRRPCPRATPHHVVEVVRAAAPGARHHAARRVRAAEPRERVVGRARTAAGRVWVFSGGLAGCSRAGGA